MGYLRTDLGANIWSQCTALSREHKSNMMVNPCRSLASPSDSWPNMPFLFPAQYENHVHRGHKKTKHKTVTSENWKKLPDPKDGSSKAGSWVFNQAVENERESILEEPAPSQTKEETTKSLRASAIGALATFESSAPTDERSCNMPMCYSGRAALRRGQCDMTSVGNGRKTCQQYPAHWGSDDRSIRTPIVGISCQATTNEDVTNREDLAYASELLSV